jgi:hypothetical protein
LDARTQEAKLLHLREFYKKQSTSDLERALFERIQNSITSGRQALWLGTNAPNTHFDRKVLKTWALKGETWTLWELSIHR